jgi:hypothetical protein
MPHIRSLSRAWTGEQGVNLPLVTGRSIILLVYEDQGRFDHAEETLKHMLEKEPGANHEIALNLVNDLAVVHCRQVR